MTNHGQLNLRDQTPPRSIYYDRGRFGRLFPSLPPFADDTREVREALKRLGSKGGLMDAGDPDPTEADPTTPEGLRGIIGGGPNNRDNDRLGSDGRLVMTAGMTFLGQFLDHDMTFDTTSSLERQSDPESIANFRTPLLELDSMYGSGPSVNPHMYDRETGRTKFLIDEGWPLDLPRNSQGIALIGEPRNDENVIVSQLHLVFLKFHNAAVDWVRANTGLTDNGKIFAEAQRLVRWHYQWVIIYEYLYKTVGRGLVTDLLKNGRRFYDWRHEPFIPVEFSVAAFRFGHSQIRPGYIANHGRRGAGGEAAVPFVAPILNLKAHGNETDPNDLRGGRRHPRRFVDWDTFFDFGNDKLRPNKLIDPKLSTVLFALPFRSPGLVDQGEINSLAQRNLLRHLTFQLPSGQAVARAMGEEPVKMKNLAADAEFRKLGLHESTPLWYYILEEANVQEGVAGRRLGTVGGRIVAEVMIGLLEGDRSSFLVQYPRWKPVWGNGGTFSMRDLICMAGVIPPGVDPANCRGGGAEAMAAVDTGVVPEDSTRDRKGNRDA